MGRTRENKSTVINDIRDRLQESQLAVLIDYKGLSVAELSNLRQRLRPNGGSCKIAKNTFVHLAVDGDENWQPMQEFLKGQAALLLAKDDLSSVIKAYKSFQKETKKTEVVGGVLEGRALTKAEVEALGDLPSKEQLIAQIAGGINALATKLAFAVKEVPASIARGIKAYSEQE
jgi:large subunit ribosomal protein L10